MKKLGFAVLLAVTLMGLVAMVIRLSQGLSVTAMTQHVPWGLWVVMYIYFIGLSAGSFLISTLTYVFGVRRLDAVGPLALLQALGCMVLGLLFIFLDLGHPERFLNVFVHWNYSSVLAWECLFYTVYLVIVLAELYIIYKPVLLKQSLNPVQQGARLRWLMVLGIIGIPVAIGVHGGTGAIFAVVKSRAIWYTGLFPIIFLVSALVSGAGLLTFLTAALIPLERSEKLALVQTLAKLTVGVLALDLLLETSEVLVTLYGGIPTHIVAWQTILFGPYRWVFWLMEIGVGAVIPIVIVLNPSTRKSTAWLGTAGLLVVCGVVGVRWNIVIPALLSPAFDTLPAAYHAERFMLWYLPTINEWLVMLGAIALGVWFFIIVLKILPVKAEQGVH